MKEEIAKKWVAALRSGEYNQVRNVLKRTKGQGHLSTSIVGFCCLGVLCDLYSKEKGVPWEPDESSCGLETIHEATASLPQEVLAWAEMNMNGDPRVKTSHLNFPAKLGAKSLRLVELNDSVGLGFDRIADLIEEQYKDL